MTATHDYPHDRQYWAELAARILDSIRPKPKLKGKP